MAGPLPKADRSSNFEDIMLSSKEWLNLQQTAPFLFPGRGFPAEQSQFYQAARNLFMHPSPVIMRYISMTDPPLSLHVPLFALSMSVPTAQLEELHLSGGMPPHTRSMSGASASSAVRNRAIIMRDVLSSFEPDLLPSEYSPVIFQEIINRNDPPLDPSYHVRNVDLDGTLFRLGSYIPEWFAILGSMKPKYDLVISYCQRLEERFEKIFTEYSELPNPPAANMEPSEEVERMITRLREYYDNAREDRRERRAQESTVDISLTNTIDRRFALMLVKQLRALCEHSTVRPAQRRQKSPRTPTSIKSYLFEEIIGSASPQTGFFALDVLEECSTESLRSLQPDQDRLPGLRTLQMLLEEKGASSEYQTRFAQLVTQEEAEEE